MCQGQLKKNDKIVILFKKITTRIWLSRSKLFLKNDDFISHQLSQNSQHTFYGTVQLLYKLSLKYFPEEGKQS